MKMGPQSPVAKAQKLKVLVRACTKRRIHIDNTISYWHHDVVNAHAPLMTDLFLETFRRNGELLTAGDRLVASLQLTSASWQLLGAIGLSPTDLPVAHVARNMGLSRQAVQRLVNDLATQGLVAVAPNPHHQRAKLVVMTANGKAAFDSAMDRQVPWAEKLSLGLASAELKTAFRVLRTLRNRLQTQNDLSSRETENVEKLV